MRYLQRWLTVHRFLPAVPIWSCYTARRRKLFTMSINIFLRKKIAMISYYLQIRLFIVLRKQQTFLKELLHGFIQKEGNRHQNALSSVHLLRVLPLSRTLMILIKVSLGELYSPLIVWMKFPHWWKWKRS